MLPVKMIVTDLDRSLLRDDKTISGFTADVFRRCRSIGIKTVFATARPIRGVQALNIDITPDAIICHSGGIIMIDGRIHQRHVIKYGKAKELVLMMGEKFPEATISAEIDDVMYTNFDLDAYWDYKRIDFNDLPKTDADKIIIGSIPLDEIYKLEKLLPDDLYLIIDSGKFGLIQNRKATKWEGVRVISGHFGVDVKEMVSFGDDYSDCEMLKCCGFGVAVQNGIDEAKSAAGFVCDTNENDGVAKWIANNLL